MMFFIHLLLFASNSSAACLPQRDFAEIEKQFEFQKWDSDKNSWTKIQDISCETASDPILNQIMASLVELKNLPILEKLQGVWQSDVLSALPFDFFKTAAQVLRIDSTGVSPICDPQSKNSTTIAFAEGNQERGTIHICPAIKNNSSLQIMRDLVHEARHISNGGKTAYSHVACFHGGLMGNFACDENFSDGGSYAVGLEFLIKISRTESIPLSEREIAHRLAFEEALLHFNFWPAATQESLVLLKENGEIILFDYLTKTSTVLQKNTSANALMTLRLSPTIFDPDSGTVKTYVGRDSQKNRLFTDTAGIFADKFRLEFSSEQKANLRDVYYGMEYVCFLYAKSLYCEGNSDDKSVTLFFPANFVATQFAFMNEPIGGFDFVHIVTQSGELYMLPTNKQVSNWQMSDLEPTPTFKGFLSVAILNGMVRLALTQDGRLVSFENPAGPFTEIQKGPFNKMIAPFYWSSALDEI